MDITAIRPLIEHLSSNINELEESLQPLLHTALSSNASKLPLLDQAKLFVLATYALESLLFSSLRVAGVNAKEHPVFHELARVKQYFAKIKAAESAGTKRSSTLDKEAAARFIKHGLAGNEQYDRARAERVAREKAGAKRKLEDMRVGTHTRFDGAAKRIKMVEGEIESEKNISEVGDQGDEDSSMSELPKKGKKKSKHERRHEREQRSRSEREEGGSLPTLGADHQDDDDGGGISLVKPASDTSPRSSIKDMDTLQQSSTDTSEGKKRKRKNKKKKAKTGD